MVRACTAYASTRFLSQLYTHPYTHLYISHFVSLPAETETTPVNCDRITVLDETSVLHLSKFFSLNGEQPSPWLLDTAIRPLVNCCLVCMIRANLETYQTVSQSLTTGKYPIRNKSHAKPLTGLRITLSHTLVRTTSTLNRTQNPIDIGRSAPLLVLEDFHAKLLLARLYHLHIREHAVVFKSPRQFCGDCGVGM